MTRRLLLASDHGGFPLKQQLKNALAARGIDTVDLGTDSETSVDYTAYAHDLAERILAGEATMGILICGTGIGVSMAANRHRGIRAALCQCPYTAKMAREHNNANVLCLGGRLIGEALALEIVQTFLDTPFQGGRHETRVQHIDVP
jgi:ribose 5-phosphate isomerase B